MNKNTIKLIIEFMKVIGLFIGILVIAPLYMIFRDN